MAETRRLTDRLVHELVGEGHRNLYMTSAHFKSAVDTLVRMLPMMVDGFALDAEQKDAEMSKLAAAAVIGQPKPVVHPRPGMAPATEPPRANYEECPSCQWGFWSPGHVHYTRADHREHVAHHAAGIEDKAGCFLCEHP